MPTKIETKLDSISTPGLVAVKKTNIEEIVDNATADYKFSFLEKLVGGFGENMQSLVPQLVTYAVDSALEFVKDDLNEIEDFFGIEVRSTKEAEMAERAASLAIRSLSGTSRMKMGMFGEYAWKFLSDFRLDDLEQKRVKALEALPQKQKDLQQETAEKVRDLALYTSSLYEDASLVPDRAGSLLVVGRHISTAVDSVSEKGGKAIGAVTIKTGFAFAKSMNFVGKELVHVVDIAVENYRAAQALAKRR